MVINIYIFIFFAKLCIPTKNGRQTIQILNQKNLKLGYPPQVM